MAIVEVLYVANCPGHERLLPAVRRLADTWGAELRMRRIDTPAEAVAERFLGSPTVRVDGVDVEPGAGVRTDFGVKCRLYRTADGLAPAPGTAWIEAALERPR